MTTEYNRAKRSAAEVQTELAGVMSDAANTCEKVAEGIRSMVGGRAVEDSAGGQTRVAADRATGEL